MEKERIDKLLVERGLAPSRERAQAYLMAGRVLLDDEPITKAGHKVALDADIRLRGEDTGHVGRGALKLKAALQTWSIDLQGKRCLDVGASTGGFTQMMLEAGASRVYALDVGTNQLDYRLRHHPQVTCLEGVNFRHAEPGLVGALVDFISIDVSFISLKLILPSAWNFLTPGGRLVALFKPQFEVGREFIAKGGLVRDAAARQVALAGIQQFALSLGFVGLGETDSPIKGKKSGNQESLIYLAKPL